MQRKIEAYLKWGVHEVWLIFPDINTLFIHTLAGAQRLSEGAFLTSHYIPGWQLQVAEIFENL
jgi:Uma2 family endonuclease